MVVRYYTIKDISHYRILSESDLKWWPGARSEGHRRVGRPIVTIKHMYGKEQIARLGCFGFQTARSGGLTMLTAEDRALVTQLGDKLLELYAEM